MSDYYEDEYYNDYHDEDPEPACWSQHLTLFKRDGKLYLYELTLGGFFGVSWSFGYPDTVLYESEFPLEQAVRRLITPCQNIGKTLNEGESKDITWMIYHHEIAKIRQLGRSHVGKIFQW